MKRPSRPGKSGPDKSFNKEDKRKSPDRGPKSFDRSGKSRSGGDDSGSAFSSGNTEGRGAGGRKKPYGTREDGPQSPRAGRRPKPYGTREDSAGGGAQRRSKPYGTRDDKPQRGGSDRPKPYGTREDKPERSFDDRKGPKSFDSREDRPKRNFDKDDRGGARPYPKREDKPKRSFDKDDRGGAKSYPKRDDKPYGSREDRPKRNFDKDDRGSARPYPKRDDKPRSFDDRKGPKSYDNREDRPKRSFDKDDKGGARPYPKREDKPKRSFDKDDRGGKPYPKREDKPKRSFGNGDKPYSKDSKRGKKFDKGDKAVDKKETPKKKFGDGIFDSDKPSYKERMAKEQEEYGFEPLIEDISKELEEDPATAKPAFHTPHKYKRGAEATDDTAKEEQKEPVESKRKRKYKEEDEEDEDEIAEDENKLMPLNKYIAHSGECSRRDAAELVKQGKVKVNGELVMDPGYRVQETDKVTLVGKKLTPQRNLVYLLLNKPKGFITTTEDPQERKTVMDLVANADIERLYPVGRLDRNTSGLLLMTNDGDLAQRLSHPSYETKKVYQVSLDKQLTKADFDKIVAGVELEDGKAVIDELAYLESKDEVGLEIHSGRNRIVRRIFESLGYEVVKLDRVMYAGLTKKNLPRSKWRFLSEEEIIRLKHYKI